MRLLYLVSPWKPLLFCDLFLSVVSLCSVSVLCVFFMCFCFCLFACLSSSCSVLISPGRHALMCENIVWVFVSSAWSPFLGSISVRNEADPSPTNNLKDSETWNASPGIWKQTWNITWLFRNIENEWDLDVYTRFCPEEWLPACGAEWGICLVCSLRGG